jgi:hypothetical protein
MAQSFHDWSTPTTEELTMPPLTSPPNQPLRAASGTAAEAAPWIERLARVGYVAKGVVYVIIGVLAARAAFGAGGRTTGSRGAMETIIQQPFGRTMLAVIAIGLLGYSAWQLIAAATDAERKGSEAKGLALRVAQAGRALVYAGLALSAARLVMGEPGGDGGGDASAADWTARLMAAPAGRWLVGLAGAGVIGYALYQLYRAYAAKVRKHLDLSEATPSQAEWVVRLGRFGIAARGVVFVVIGWFLVRAAMEYDPDRASGLGGALATLARQDYGAWLLGIVALGLIAYGVYQFANARYRRIRLA